jgi:hypothetical protein
MCFVVRCCSLLGCLLLAPLAGAQEAKQPPSPQDLLAKTRPGPEHARLAALDGDWRITITMGGGPQQAVWRGEAAAKPIVGRRFLEITYKAEGAGEPAEGVLLLGFDRRHGEYTLVALDQWGTYWVTARGKPTEGSPVIKMYGRDDDPMMKAMGLTKEFAFALDLTDAAHPKLAALMIDTRTPERKELKLVEYAFERASK